ncbi:hypothetical protein QL285_069971 [Trifolium repens]|nr:hypothetical protein QL285_069971 [Trifolium repens]
MHCTKRTPRIFHWETRRILLQTQKSFVTGNPNFICYGEVYGLVHLLKLEINKAFDSVGIGLFQQIDTFTSHYTRALEDLLQKLICSQR